MFVEENIYMIFVKYKDNTYIHIFILI